MRQSHTNDTAKTASALQTWARGLLLLLTAMSMSACEVDSFFDPSRVGYFEYYPTTIQVLDRIDVIEPKSDYWSNAEPPEPEDLLPRDLMYYIYPGDMLTVRVHELRDPGAWEDVVRRVDPAGNFRMPVLGDVGAAGLTQQQFQDLLTRLLHEQVMRNPRVEVVVDLGRGLRYTVYGWVQAPGVFNLDNPNLRLVDALAIAGGVPQTTKEVYVIRQVLLSQEMLPSFDQSHGNLPSTTTRPDQQPVDIEDLIEQLDDRGAATRPDVRPGMLQDTQPAIDIDQLEPVRTQPPPPPVDVDQMQPPSSGADSFIYVEERGEWVRIPGKTADGEVPPDPATTSAEPNLVLDRIIVIDYQQLARGDSGLNVVIRPNDRIYVEGPMQGFVYIGGEIIRPGVYSLPNMGRLTLSRFISTAGGFGPIAIPERVDLTRVVAHNREATIRLDVKAIFARTEPDVLLKPDDHVIVGTNWFATPLAVMRNGFRMTYGFGFLLDRNFGNDVFGAPPEDGGISF